MTKDHYTYRVTWSPEDEEYVGLCAEFPSLSWLASTSQKALAGIQHVVAETVEDMRSNGEEVPVAFADRHYSGEFRVRLPPHVHRMLAVQAAEQAAEQGISLNRLTSAKLAG